MTVRVVLADDQALVRAGFRSLLDHSAGIEVVGEAADGVGALAVTRETVPDVVLMDIQMPTLDGVEATRRISADPALGGVRVIMLTTFEFDGYVFDSLRAGASGFLLKDIDPVDLRRAIAVVAGGEALLAPSVTRRLIAAFAARPAPRVDGDAKRRLLTERELEVTTLVAEGRPNDEIARRLTISPGTVKTHVSRAMVKVGARDRAQLVVFAYESGLVTPSGP